MVCALAVIALAYLRRQDAFNSLLLVQLIFYPLFSLLLAFLMPLIYTINASSNKSWNTIVANTSKWSYSIYLCHVFFKDAMYLVSGKLGLTDSWPIMALLAVLWLAFVYITSALVYKNFEVPIMRKLLPQQLEKSPTSKAESPA